MKHLLATVFVFSLIMMTQGALAATATSTLSWSPPTERVDGSPFSVEDIKEYRVFYTVDGQPTTDSEFVVVGADATGEVVVLDLKPRVELYTVSFAVVVVDTQGRESVQSETVSKQFAVDSTTAPSPPTNLQFTVACGDGCVIEEIVREQ